MVACMKGKGILMHEADAGPVPWDTNQGGIIKIINDNCNNDNNKNSTPGTKNEHFI